MSRSLPSGRGFLFEGALLLSDDNWKDSQQSEVEATGIPPADDLESALIATLAPGAYTVSLRGQDGGTGIGLVEAYDLDTVAQSSLTNISTRGLVQTGDDGLIAGFIVGNGGSNTVVVRAIGPSLTAGGVGNPLADPTLDLYDANGAVIRSDDNWRHPGVAHPIDRPRAGGIGVGLVEVYNLQ